MQVILADARLSVFISDANSNKVSSRVRQAEKEICPSTTTKRPGITLHARVILNVAYTFK